MIRPPQAFLAAALVAPAAWGQQMTLHCYGDFKEDGGSRQSVLKVSIAGELALLSEGPLAAPLEAAVTRTEASYQLRAENTVLIIDRETAEFSLLIRSEAGAVGGRGKCQRDDSATRVPLRT